MINLKLKKYLRSASFAVISGILAGLAASVFLILLNMATNSRNSHPYIIWALPLAGLFIGWIYHRFGQDIAAGHNLIIDEIHNPQKTIPFHMAPFILLGTIMTHLFGGSAGREGTAVQMGASLTDQLSLFFKLEAKERNKLLQAGAGAGFGAAIGAPLAGVIFGMEVINIGSLSLSAFFECFISSFVGYWVTLLLRAPHSHYPRFLIPTFTLKIFICVVVAGIAFGIAAKIFTMMAHLVEKTANRYILYSPLKPFFGGIILVSLYYWEGTYKYVGLGIPYIQEAISSPATFKEPFLKSIFTALTVGTGFKGGEFIPLVFIGTTLGSALSIILPISFQLLAALGFAAVFAGASNTPIACTLMAIEIFGYHIGPYAFLACFLSYYLSGYSGIYKSQPLKMKKILRLRSRFK